MTEKWQKIGRWLRGSFEHEQSPRLLDKSCRRW